MLASDSSDCACQLPSVLSAAALVRVVPHRVPPQSSAAPYHTRHISPCLLVYISRKKPSPTQATWAQTAALMYMYVYQEIKKTIFKNG